MQKGRDDNRDYRRITEKTVEKMTKRSFYFYTVMLLTTLFVFSTIGIIAIVKLSGILLFIFIAGILFFSLAGVIKYQKDRKMVESIAHAGILLVGVTFLVGIFISVDSMGGTVSFEFLSLSIFSFCVVAFALLIPVYRRYRELKQEERMLPATNYIDNLGLKSNWNPPVFSPEEWEMRMEKIWNGTKIIASAPAGAGFLLMLFPFIVEQREILLVKTFLIFLGLLLVISGLVFLSIGLWAKKQIKKENDIYLETKASWNITDFDVGKEAVEEFLHKNGHFYRAERNDKVNYPDYKYILESGTYLHLVFIVQKHPTHYFGWFGIGYKLLDYNEARKLQQELDEYLTERDILKRSQ